MKRQDVGKLGETYAAHFLLAQGYTILKNNFHTRYGEIDLIVQSLNSNTLVFCEVKTRTNTLFGEPEDSINYKKRQKIFKSAIIYLNSIQEKILSWRIDIIAVKLRADKSLKNIRHIKNI